MSYKHERYCKDCRNICKPSGAQYEPHPESICRRCETSNWVTGEHILGLCKNQNISGHCSLFEEKETP